MRVFLSWSKPTSKKVAAALREWLIQPINVLDPWMSDADIDAGKKWGSDIEKELEAAQAGVLCLTRENLTQPWLLFEAGALAKQIAEKTRVIPYRFDVGERDVEGPLTQFQAVDADKPGTWKLIKSLNNALPQPRQEKALEKAFEAFWPDLEKAFAQIREEAAQTSKVPPGRSDRQVLDEILTAVRGMQRSMPMSSGLGLGVSGVGVGERIFARELARDLKRALIETGVDPAGATASDKARAIQFLNWRAAHDANDEPDPEPKG